MKGFKKNSMKFDQYTFFAQIPAGIISIIPLILLHHFYINPDLSGLMLAILKIKWVENVTLLLIFVLVATELSRQVSKSLLETLYFKKKLYLPTTNMLLYLNNRITNDKKQLISTKLYKDFNIHLPNTKEQEKNELQSRKKFAEAVALIIVKVGKGKLVFARNIQYGFSRNIVGASIVGFILSAFDVFFFKKIYINNPAAGFSIILCLIYLLPIVFSKLLVNFTGNLYAEKLFDEYLALP